MTTLNGEQVAGVTALTALCTFEDMYLENGGTPFAATVVGQRGFMTLADSEVSVPAVSGEGTDWMAHHLHTPLEIDTAIAGAAPIAAQAQSRTLSEPPPPAVETPDDDSTVPA
jgi:hypothetical protein